MDFALDAEETYLVIRDKLTMMTEIEAAVDPDSVLRNRLVVLRVDWPLTWLWQLLLFGFCHADLPRNAKS